jgi:S1-C subfamily serine protease
MDITATLPSIVAVRAHIPDDAFTAAGLGTLREGSGVVIRETGLVLTIGYLITEAEEVWLTRQDGHVVAAHALAYDQETGFGLVQALGPLDLPALEFGDSAATKLGDTVVFADGRGQSVKAAIVGKQEFAGYWEYLLDEAIYTAPATVNWQGAALINKEGKLLGVGSLVVGDAMGGRGQVPGNMFVPIDLLKPILGDLIAQGKTSSKPRPWLGVSTQDMQGKLLVTRVSPDSPADMAGLANGDIILGIRGEQVKGHTDFYRKLWATGDAGADVVLDVLKGTEVKKLEVHSMDREKYLRPRPTY